MNHCMKLFVPLFLMILGVLPVLADKVVYINRANLAELKPEQLLGKTYIENRYDDAGYLLSQSFFAADGSPTVSKDNIHRISSGYDEAGDMVEQSFFGVDNTPIVDANKIHRYSWTYNKHFQTSVSCWGGDGKPTVDEMGIHRKEWTYDGERRRISESYWGINGKKCKNKAGIHLIQYSYDANNHLWSESFYGTDEKPVQDRSGVSRKEYGYDSKGNPAVVSYFNLKGEMLMEGHMSNIVVPQLDSDRVVEP